MYLLRYRREAEWRVVVIADAYPVAHARMLAAGLEPGTFVNGHAVIRASIEMLPADAVGLCRCRVLQGPFLGTADGECWNRVGVRSLLLEILHASIVSRISKFFSRVLP